jgi:hypothetical protein
MPAMSRRVDVLISAMRALLVLVALTATASANVARAVFPGTPAGEPNGLRDIAIAREELVIDLHALADGPFGHVHATYHLVNRGAEQREPLVFVSGTHDERAAGITVQLDGHAVETMPQADQRSLSVAWHPPDTTPDFDGGTRWYGVDKPTLLGFVATIPAGEHTLEVDADVSPALDRRSGDVLVWQLAYVLAPARDWGGFGTLDLTVRIPDDWELAITPSIDAGHATFDKLPADAIALTTRARVGTLHRALAIGLPIGVIVAIVAGIAALIALGRRRRGSIASSGLIAFIGGLVWGGVLAVTGALAALAPTFAVPAGQEASHGYAIGFGVLLAIVAGVVAVPIGFVIVTVAARRGSLRS